MTRFINPYNFISIDDPCVRKKREDWFSDDLITGYVDVMLETLTPLFIPNTSNKDAFHKHLPNDPTTKINSYDFYSYEDIAGQEDRTNQYSRPIIPGSSVRGAVRSVYEAAVNGCLSQLDREKRDVLYKRTNAAKTPGILMYDETRKVWSLYGADRVMMKVGNCNRDPAGVGTRWEEKFAKTRQCDFPNGKRYKTGQIVYIKESDYTYESARGFDTHLKTATLISDQPGQGLIKGYVLNGQIFQNKHHNSIMVPNTKIGKVCDLSSDDLKRLLDVLDLYSDPKVNKSHKGYGEYEDCLSKQGPTPVFYQLLGTGELYLSPACLTKEVFRQTLNNLFTMQGKHQPCNSIAEVCEACALFGFVADEGDSSTSHFQFQDAFPCDENGEETQMGEDWSGWYLPPRFLPELSTPKPSTVEFYTEKPTIRNDITDWNYDYYQTGTNYSAVRTAYPAANQLKLRGRKGYYHSAVTQDMPNGQETERNSFVREVKSGKHFHMRITYKGITKIQLNRFLWALTFGDEKCAYKLGRGKPVGLGSVRFIPRDVMIRKIRKDQEDIRWECTEHEWEMKQLAEAAHIVTGQKNIRELQTLYKYPGPATIAIPVRYPWSGDPAHPESYIWFTQIRRPQNRRIVLSHILDPDPSLLCEAEAINPQNQQHGNPNQGHQQNHAPGHQGGNPPHGNAQPGNPPRGNAQPGNPQRGNPQPGNPQRGNAQQRDQRRDNEDFRSSPFAKLMNLPKNDDDSEAKKEPTPKKNDEGRNKS